MPYKPAKNQIPQGIECRHCGCRMNEITHTKHFVVTYNGKTRTITKRRRLCRHCQLPFTTIEVYEDEENTNLPEDVRPFQPPPAPTGVYCPPPSIPPAVAAGEDNLPPKKRPRRYKRG